MEGGAESSVEPGDEGIAVANDEHCDSLRAWLFVYAPIWFAWVTLTMVAGFLLKSHILQNADSFLMMDKRMEWGVASAAFPSVGFGQLLVDLSQRDIIATPVLGGFCLLSVVCIWLTCIHMLGSLIPVAQALYMMIILADVFVQFAISACLLFLSVLASAVFGVCRWGSGTLIDVLKAARRYLVNGYAPTVSIQ